MIEGTTVFTIVQGDSLSFSLSLQGYPSSTWAGKVVFTDDGNHELDAPGTPNTAGGWDFSLTSAQTLQLSPGPKQVYLQVSSGVQRISQPVGSVQVMSDPMGQLPPSEAQVAFDAIMATIAIIVAQPEATASFNGQSYTLQNLKDLYAIRDRIAVEVDAELRAMGLSTKKSWKTIQNRFV